MSIKYNIQVLLLIFLTQCTTMEPEFKVFGKDELLKDIKINLKVIRQAKYPDNEYTVKTLLFNGERHMVQLEHAFIYETYFSYKDEFVGTLSFENIMKNTLDYINHIYVFKLEDKICIQYVGRKSQIENKKGFKSLPAMPIEDFYNLHGIKNEQKDSFNQLFFGFYDPKKSIFQKLKPLD